MSDDISFIWHVDDIVDALTSGVDAVGGLGKIPVTVSMDEYTEDFYRFDIQKSFTSLTSSAEFRLLVAEYQKSNPGASIRIHFNTFVGRESAALSFGGQSLVIVALDNLEYTYGTKSGGRESFSLAHILAHEILHILTGKEDGPEFNGIVNKVIAEVDGSAPRSDDYYDVQKNKFCFVAGTMILMADGSEKAIEWIKSGDMVMAFDERLANGRGELRPSRVVRTFVNYSNRVIDFHGIGVTADHSFLCGDGRHAGSFRSIMDIIVDDGAVVDKNGRLFRAATNCEVGSRGDSFVRVNLIRKMILRATGQCANVVVEQGRIRAGTRMINPDGSSFSLLEMMNAAKWQLQEDGLVVHAPEQGARPLGYVGARLPRPEDFILARSKLTLGSVPD